MTVTTLDTHETVKSPTAVGFSDSQAEALTHAIRQGQNIDLSNLVTKADLGRDTADLRREMAEIKADMIKWVVGMGFAQVAMIVALLRLLPSGHP